MIRMIKGIFSSSIPTSSNVVKEEEQDEELDSDAQRDLPNFEDDQHLQTQDQDERAHADAGTGAMDPPSSFVNKTSKAVNGELASSSAMKSSGTKKNKSKDTIDARRIKNQKRKEKKKQKKRDSSALDSSAMESSVMGKETEAQGINDRGANKAVAAEADRSFVSPDLSRTMMSLFGDEPATKQVTETPKAKRPKKSKSSSKKQLNAQTHEANGLASQIPEEPASVDEETQDLWTLIRKEQLAKRKEKKTKRATSAVDSEGSASNQRSQSTELSLAEKIKKAKQKARLSPRKPSQESIAALQDEDDFEALLHQPLTPALINSSRPDTPVQPTQEDIAEAEAQIQSNAWSTGQVDPDPEDDDDEAPERPSKKALGKRKASNTALESNSKRKKSKKAAETTPKLTTYGFVAGSDEMPRDRSPSVSIDASLLAREAASMYASQMDMERTSPILQAPASSLAYTSSQQRRPTPAFTPVNPRRPLAAVVIHAPAKDPYELPPSSQPHPESEPELPQKAPTSTERRKRRLPIGDAESSKVNGSGNSARRRKSEVASRAIKSTTPKSSASKVKIPKSRTPKAPASSQATPASKGHRLPDDDVKAIAEAVETYREDNDLREVDLNAIVQGQISNKESAREFWAYLYEQVPDVPKTKVQNHCRRNFHNFEARGTWTAEADQDLRDAYERNPGKWKQIGAELNRFSEDCRDRWRNYLICGDNQKKATWEKEEEERLRDVVEELLVRIREDENREPDDAREDDYIKLDWVKASAMMGHTRSRLQCSIKWKKIQEREDAGIKDPVAFQPISTAAWRLEDAERNARRMKARDKLDLLYQIRESKAGSEGKIPWLPIQQELGLKGKKMALHVCYRNLKEHIPDSDEMKLQDVVSVLIDLYEAAAPGEPQGFKKFFSPSRYNKFDMDENDSNEAFKRAKKRRTSSAKVGVDNGEGPSTKPARLRLAKGKKAAMLSEMDRDNDHTPAKNSPKKFRSRMKAAGQKESQETATDHLESADDLGAAFEAVKSSQGRSPRVAKKPLMAARTSKSVKRLSAKRVYDSDSDEEPMATEASTPKAAAATQREEQLDEDDHSDEEMQQNGRYHPYPDLPRTRQEVPESDINMGNAPSAAEVQLDSEYEADDQEYPSNTHDQASIDLDAEPQYGTANGARNGMNSDSDDEESVDYGRARLRSESFDLDNTPRAGLTNGNHNEGSDDESAVGIGTTSGQKFRFLRSPSRDSNGGSSSASDIPAVI
ncbi:RNA polymerase I enhancer binding protein [Cadophora gregata f. sp. sojae]|nr:RNA polymerase I enhancer binding protein [Cadophora gregata f. sp. sojae]